MLFAGTSIGEIILTETLIANKQITLILERIKLAIIDFGVLWDTLTFLFQNEVIELWETLGANELIGGFLEL